MVPGETLHRARHVPVAGQAPRAASRAQEHVSVGHGEVRVYIHPSDSESLHWAQKLGGTLPDQALAARNLAGSRRVTILRRLPLNHSCVAREAPAAFFVRPYHTANMCHLYNEALLPMAHLMHGVPPPRELYYYGDHMLHERPLKHWDEVRARFGAAARVDSPAQALRTSRR